MFCGEEEDEAAKLQLELGVLVKRTTLDVGKRVLNEVQGGSHVS